MGAWGAGVFDNDDALDWIDQLENGGATALTEAFAAIADADAYVDASDASMALAAAEVAAAARGRPAADLPGEVEAWVKLNGASVAPDVIPLAMDAVRRVREDSELRELWEEQDPSEWYAAVDDLLGRLRASQ